MLTINAEVVKTKRQSNECFTIRLRFTLDRRMKRLSTSLFATQKDLTKDFKIKSSSPLKGKVERLIRDYQEKCSQLQVELNNYTIEDIMDYLETKDFKIKSSSPLKGKVERLIRDYQEKCSQLQVELNNYTIEDIMDYLDGERQKQQTIDFIKFSREWIASATIKGAPNYTTAINALVRFVGKEELDINLITLDFLEQFKAFLIGERDARTKKLIQQGKRVTSNRTLSLYLVSIKKLFNEAFLEQFKAFLIGERDARTKKLIQQGKRVTSNRTLSLYLVSIKKLFNEAKRKYNKKDKNLILIPNSPFEDFKIPKQEATRKRAIPADIIKKVWKLPYKDMKKGYKSTCRYNLAKDCFILSFCLMGIEERI